MFVYPVTKPTLNFLAWTSLILGFVGAIGLTHTLAGILASRDLNFVLLAALCGLAGGIAILSKKLRILPALAATFLLLALDLGPAEGATTGTVANAMLALLFAFMAGASIPCIIALSKAKPIA